ncbi:hypothetical protein [Chitinophaga tropicalis]|uniref:Uncharacterized protein n=1 Tax=Chitinophaga tropicalis TaxID=2683588 RepID=A0A7K1UAI8_9BACT|nr:hypothetical protein [Chitinophaga tropicalis]MVT11387.1 hypothetical protein [Chitinophaga tropicalis]
MATSIEIFKEAVKTSIKDKVAEGSILNSDIAARFYDAADLILSVAAEGGVGLEGAATPSTNPGAPEGKRMWITSTPGTYTNFSGVEVNNGELVFLIDNGTAYTKLVVPVDPVPVTTVQVAGVGKNKLDSSAFVEGNVNSSGTLDAVLPLTGWQRTARVPVVAGTTYTFSAVGFTASSSKYVVFYTASNVYISRVTITTAPPFSFTVPATATNIVINLKEPANAAPTNVQLEIGNAATAYEAYIPPVNAADTIKTNPLAASYLIDSPGNRAFITAMLNNNVTTQNVYSKNILDEENIKVGLVSSSGVILTTAGWLRSDKTPITAGSVYTFSALNYVPSTAKVLAYYTASDVYITRTSVATAPPFTFTPPAGAAYFILNLKEPTDATTPSQMQVENENVATSYVPHRKTVISQILGYDLLSSNSSSAPTTQIQALVNLYPQIYGKLQNFRKRYAGPLNATADDRVKIIMEGDSIFAREMHTTIGPVAPASYPPTFVTNNFGANLFRSLLSLERPVYSRWDKAGTFTETGTWSIETTGWDDAGTRPNDTRLSTTSAAALSFAVAAAYNRFNFVDRTDLAASTSIAIAVTGGAGKVEVKLPGATVWVEANGALLSQLEVAGTRRSNSVYARRVEFRKVGATIGTSVTITLTKPADSTKFLYWGLELISGAKPYIQLVNIARGGNTLAQLTNYIQNDLIERKPNLVLFEIPLLNMVAASQLPSYSVNWVQDFLYGDRAGNTNTWNLKTASNNWVDFEVLCVLPHFARSYFNSDGSMITQSSGYTMAEIWSAVKSFLYEKGDIPFVDMSAAFVREAESGYLGNYYNAFAGSGVNGNTLSSDGVHLNDRGTAVYAKHLCPIFDLNSI